MRNHVSNAHAFLSFQNFGVGRSRNVWIGATQIPGASPNTLWHWAHSKQPIAYPGIWSPGEPNDFLGKDETCGEFYVHNRRINDEQCTSRLFRNALCAFSTPPPSFLLSHSRARGPPERKRSSVACRKTAVYIHEKERGSVSS